MILVPVVVLPDLRARVKSLFSVISSQLAVDFGDTCSTTHLRPPPPLWYPHLPRPFPHHHHHHQYHHHHCHQHHPYELHHHPQQRMSEPEPDPYVKIGEQWEWQWQGKEEAYVEPGEAEEAD